MRDPEARILIVEDEPSFVEALKVGLQREGFSIDVANDGVDALRRFDEFEPDLILLDVMLPKISGIDVCREIRAMSKVPIIMVTARADEIDMVVGLEVGADDYITKPYRLRELVARMRSLLRRSNWPPVVVADFVDEGVVLEVGDVRVDTDRHEVVVRGSAVSLPLKEFDLLTLFMENPGRVLTRDVLIDRIWGSNYVGDTKTLDVHVRRLRSKLETDPSNPDHIVTIRGVGYRYARA